MCFFRRLAVDPAQEALVEQMANQTDLGALQGWVNMAAGARKISMGGFDVTSLISGFVGSSSGGTSAPSGGGLGSLANPATLASTFGGMIAIFFFCILFAVISFFLLIFFYCCRATCGACGGAEMRKDKDYSQNEKICAFACLGIGAVLSFVAIVLGLYSNSLIDQGISNTLIIFNVTVDDILSLPPKVEATVDDVANNINTTALAVVADLSAAPATILAPLSAVVANITSIMNNLQAGINQVVSAGNNFVRGFFLIEPARKMTHTYADRMRP